MATNKINTKAKGKDDRNKKNGSPVNEENDVFDSSLIRKPIMTSVTGFAQARKIFDLATEEVSTTNIIEDHLNGLAYDYYLC